MSIEDEKRRAGQAAAQLVESHMCVGLGTGSTARHAISELGRRLRAGEVSGVTGVATSTATAALADEIGIPRVELGAAPIDLAIDGADEIAPDLSLIKGAPCCGRRSSPRRPGRSSSSPMHPSSLRRSARPILCRLRLRPSATKPRWRCLVKLGDAVVRTSDDGVFTTDNGNMIADVRVGNLHDPSRFDRTLLAIPGVLATGLFCDIAAVAVLADGEAENGLRVD